MDNVDGLRRPSAGFEILEQFLQHDLELRQAFVIRGRVNDQLFERRRNVRAVLGEALYLLVVDAIPSESEGVGVILQLRY